MKRKENIGVLLTCVGSPVAWEMIQALKRAESLALRPVGVDMSSSALGRYYLQRFYTVPAGNDPDYPQAILEICQKESLQVVLPGSDEEAFQLAPHQAMFREHGVTCTVPRPDLVEPMSNKADMYTLLESRGITVPNYKKVAGLAEIVSAAEQLGYPQVPVILKLASGRGGRGVWKLSEKPAAEDIFARSGQLLEISLDSLIKKMRSYQTLPEMIVMEFITGDFFDIDVLSNEGCAHYIVQRKRINPAGIPFRGNIFENHAEISTMAEAVQQALALTYLYDLDIAYSAEQGVRLIEVNPRPSGSVVATVHAGLNLFEYLVRMALGLKVPQKPTPQGMTVLPKTTLFEVPPA